MATRKKKARRSAADALKVRKAERRLIAGAKANRRGSRAAPKVQLAVRIDPELMAQLQQVAEARRIDGVTPSAMQDIVSEAITQWLGTPSAPTEDLPRLLRQAAAMLDRR